MESCIETINLTKRYGETVAVRDLNLEIRRGELFGLLGLNGAGKTTTLHMLTGLIRPSAGEIRIFGMNSRKSALEIKSRTGVLVDRPCFYNYLSARRNLALLSRLAGRKESVDSILELVGLLDVASKKVGAFSSGMRQRLGLAQALLGKPELLILDEPANGLDVEATRDMLLLLRRLVDDSKVTIVLSSHLLHEVELLCDRVAVIDKGAVVACERTAALASYDETLIDLLVDSPEEAADKLRGEQWVRSATCEAGKVVVKLDGATVHQLAAFLMESGFVIRGISPRRRTLQEFFLKVLNR